MAPENRSYHVDPGESAGLARAASDRLRAAGLHVAPASTSGAAELLLQGTHRLEVGRSLRRGGRRGCRPPSDTAPIAYAGLKQLGNRRLIGLEQFIRPLQSFQSLGQRLDLLAMRLDFLLDRSDRLAQSLFECIYRIHLAMFLQEPVFGSCCLQRQEATRILKG